MGQCLNLLGVLTDAVGSPSVALRFLATLPGSLYDSFFLCGIEVVAEEPAAGLVENLGVGIGESLLPTCFILTVKCALPFRHVGRDLFSAVTGDSTILSHLCDLLRLFFSDFVEGEVEECLPVRHILGSGRFVFCPEIGDAAS